ncbi:MAG: metal ABC transporter ATP-binding protein [Verrucomicrobiaceae bacterium]|nr:MAG: metal ABC transporter ATP-binding protein [Verrucomicrobiaceae bacterium]
MSIQPDSFSADSGGGHCRHCAHHHELQIQGLAVRYQQVLALEGVTLGTSCGNTLALIGPNGAGKSTLLKAIAGLVPRSAGSILWRGARVSQWHREFAYLPQREDVDWSFPVTVRGLVEMGRYSQLGWWRRWRPVDDEKVTEALKLMHLEDLEHRQISELSGGQQQRTFIARALSQEAHVLLLDEPFNGLDRPARENLSGLLRQLAEQGRLVIASHHDLATVPALFDEVLILNRAPVAFGSVAEVFTPALLAQAFGEPDPEEKAAVIAPTAATAGREKENVLVPAEL